MNLPIIGDIVQGASKIIDSLHTSDEERLAAKGKLADLQIRMNERALEYEAARLKESAAIVRAEAGSDRWLVSSWRPLVMLTFAGLLVMHWLGFTAENLGEAEVLGLLDIVKLGLGGYVIGRSAEKIIPSTVRALKQREQ